MNLRKGPSRPQGAEARAAALAALWAGTLLWAAPQDAHAYLDPGTGSMLLSIVVGLASSGYFFIRRLPSLIRQAVFRMKGDDKALRSGGIVFYAESPAYWGTFEPVLRALSEMGQSVTYLTSAENDPVFEANIPGVSARFIGKGNSAYTSLGFLEADIFVLTTPGIDVLQIRRSKGVKRYVHLVHAATDAHGYKLFSFDYYDAVYCSGEHQRRSLRLLEAKRGTAPKDLPLLGCPYFDRMVAKRRNYRAEPEARTVLVAPTWGRAGLLTRTGSAVPKALAEAGWNVILRPHPQSFVSEADLMDKLQTELASYPNIRWDRQPDGFESLSRAEVMVSDFSGVVFDFAFVFERPVVTIGDGWQKDGYEAWDLDDPAWEMGVLEAVGTHLSANETDRVLAAVEALAANPQDASERIRHVRDAGIVNFGVAGRPIAEALVRDLETVRGAAAHRFPEAAPAKEPTRC